MELLEFLCNGSCAPFSKVFKPGIEVELLHNDITKDVFLHLFLCHGFDVELAYIDMDNTLSVITVLVLPICYIAAWCFAVPYGVALGSVGCWQCVGC